MAEYFSPDQVKAALEDTQAALAAALARIEGFRIREKIIVNELAELRKQVHGHLPPTENSSIGPLTTPTEPTPTSLVPQQQQQQPLPIAQASSPVPNQQPNWCSTSSNRTYVTDCKGEYPVHLVLNGKRVPVSLIVTKDHVDFVEVKSRIRQEDFIGITTIKGTPPVEIPEDDGSPQMGTWQILWKQGDVPQRLVFEANMHVREQLHRHTEKWLGELNNDTSQSSSSAPGEVGELAVPRNLVVGDLTMSLIGDPSQILSKDHVRALASCMPPLERMKNWHISYSTSRNGISLQTLYRKQTMGCPSLLIVKDFGGHIFGAYTADSWRVAPRFYGNGETFVFQLEPYKIMYPWRSTSSTKNDFFMYGTPECAAVGGSGHFAIWLDSELMNGSSALCGTFGSACLAHKEDFRIAMVEVWQAMQH